MVKGISNESRFGFPESFPTQNTVERWTIGRVASAAKILPLFGTFCFQLGKMAVKSTIVNAGQLGFNIGFNGLTALHNLVNSKSKWEYKYNTLRDCNLEGLKRDLGRTKAILSFLGKSVKHIAVSPDADTYQHRSLLKTIKVCEKTILGKYHEDYKQGQATLAKYR